MFSRKNQETEATLVPNQWLEDVLGLLHQTYKKERGQRFFEAYGEIYSNELVLIVSLLPEQIGEASLSLYLSTDLTQKDLPLELLKSMLDLSGNFLDDYFQDDQWSEWEPNWQKTQYKKRDYFYKVTRENISLTLEAERLLKEDNQ